MELNSAFSDTLVDHNQCLRSPIHQIPGLEEALAVPNGNVTSIYSPKYVNRHMTAMEQFKQGNIIFTFPASPVKCPGAPQKICYITEHYLRKTGKRENAKLVYNTALPVIFGVKYFADALWKVAKDRNIDVNLKTDLVRVDGSKNLATFANVDNPNEQTTIEVGLKGKFVDFRVSPDFRSILWFFRIFAIFVKTVTIFIFPPCSVRDFTCRSTTKCTKSAIGGEEPDQRCWFR